MKKTIYLLSILFLLFSCKKNGDDTVLPSPLSLKANVYIIDSNRLTLNTNPILISQGKFEFNINDTTSPYYKQGDIIVIPVNGGYLRQITSVSRIANKVIYTTIGSTMADVFEKGDITFNLNTDSLKVLAKGYTLDLNNITVYQNGPLSIKLNSGNINFDPNWKFDFDFNSSGIQTFEMSCTDAFFNGNFDLTVAATQSTNLVNRIDTLKKLTKSYTKWVVVGVIPVPITVQMDVRFLVRSNLSINAAISRKVNFTTNNTFSVGMKYNNGQWNGIYNFNPTNSFTLNQSTGTAGFNYDFYLYPEVSIKLYNIAGPYASVAFRTNISGNKASPALDWNQSIKAWLETTVGADVTILGKTISNYNKTWSTDSIKYNAPDSIVKVSGDNQLGVVDQNLPQPIKVRVVDSRGKPQIDVPVYFNVTNGGGSVQDASILTDANGYAQTKWKLGTQITIQTLEAKAKKANGVLIQNAPVEFAATTKALVLNIGDSFAGGTIFYLDNTKIHGFVTSPDLSTSIKWDSTRAANGVTYAPLPIGGLGTAMGTGAVNTAKIVSILGIRGRAAILCKNYTGGGYNDWFLPSIDELTTMYQAMFNTPNLVSGVYWSSSEDIASSNLYALRYSYNFNILAYSTVADFKNYEYRVRAIRAF